VTHSPSETRRSPSATYLVASIAVAVALFAPLATFIGALVTTDRYIIPEGITVSEDQFVSALDVIVDGTIEGDLTVFSGDVDIRGTITGGVTVFSAGTVTIHEGASVGGTVKGSSLSMTIAGSVESDVFVASGSIVVAETGDVGRDVFGFSGTLRVHGTVGRDVRGRVVRTTVDGSVGGDIDIATTSMSIGQTAVVAGDVVYRSSANASIASGATIEGTVTRLPAVGNFIYSIMLSIANLIGFLGFVVAGLVALWILRGTGARAVGAVMTRPIASLFAGIGTVIVLPLLIAVTAATLVGIPLTVILIMFGVILFIVGAVPAVTTLGHFVLWRRGGLFGGFLVGAVLWRLGVWLIPYAGVGLFTLGLVWGIGGWVMGAVAARRSDPIVPALLPPSMVMDDDVPQDWEPPLAPTPPEPEPLDVEPEQEDAEETSASPGDDGAEDAPPPPPKRDADDPISFGSSTAPMAPPQPPAERTPEEETTLAERFAALRKELVGEDGEDGPDGHDHSDGAEGP